MATLHVLTTLGVDPLCEPRFRVKRHEHIAWQEFKPEIRRAIISAHEVGHAMMAAREGVPVGPVRVSDSAEDGITDGNALADSLPDAGGRPEARKAALVLLSGAEAATAFLNTEYGAVEVSASTGRRIVWGRPGSYQDLWVAVTVLKEFGEWSHSQTVRMMHAYRMECVRWFRSDDVREILRRLSSRLAKTGVIAGSTVKRAMSALPKATRSSKTRSRG